VSHVNGAIRSIGIVLVLIVGSVIVLAHGGLLSTGSAVGLVLGLALGALVTFWWKPATKLRLPLALVSAVILVVATSPFWVALGRTALAPPTCGTVSDVGGPVGAAESADCFIQAFRVCTPRSLTEYGSGGQLDTGFTHFFRIRDSGDTCVIDDHFEWWINLNAVGSNNSGEVDVTCTGIASGSSPAQLTGCKDLGNLPELFHPSIYNTVYPTPSPSY
jgi:hypothetical protein